MANVTLQGALKLFLSTVTFLEHLLGLGIDFLIFVFSKFGEIIIG